MAKMLFFNVPGHGHINPSLPLVAELVKRNHQIIYFASEGFRARIEAAGAQFRAYTGVNDDYFTGRGLHGGVIQRVALALMTTTQEILPALLDVAREEQPDAILYDGMCPWGYYIAHHLRLPAITSLALMPVSSRSMRNLKVVRYILPMVLTDFGKGATANILSRNIGKQYNVKPLAASTLLNAPGDLSLSYTSREFHPFPDHVDKSIRFIGWTVDESTSGEPFSFAQVGDRPLIYVSLGTLNSDDAAFFKQCIEAFAGGGGDGDQFVIMTTGGRVSPETFGRLPENVAVYAWVPQIEILKRAALFVTHGGLNSIHDGLYFGLPLLIVPQQGEQAINALRVVELGAGQMLTKAPINAQTIREKAAQLLADPQAKQAAQRIGDSLRAAGGAPRGADEIEALIKNYGG